MLEINFINISFLNITHFYINSIILLQIKELFWYCRVIILSLLLNQDENKQSHINSYNSPVHRCKYGAAFIYTPLCYYAEGIS